MKGCLAPSEIPGIASGDASIFGNIAEEFIYADFVQHFGMHSGQVYSDHYNEAGYIYFLTQNNPHFDETLQLGFYSMLRSRKLGVRRPDIILHTNTEQSFYEIKPDSVSGRAAGVEKVGILSASYQFFHLPYIPGTKFRPRSHRIAYLGNALQIDLVPRLIGPGLIAYKICVNTEGVVDVVALSALLALVVKEMNKSSNSISALDLQPIFARKELLELARNLGIAATGITLATVGWRFFWKAVIKRFAARGSTAAFLSALDGPAPVGELLAVGLGIWTIVDIVRFSDEIWREAENIARQNQVL